MKLRPHHIDITDESAPVVWLDAAARLRVQLEMIADHCWLGGHADMDAAALDWVDCGLAACFAAHYRLRLNPAAPSTGDSQGR